MTGAWLTGLLKVRTAMILGTVAGIAITVGFIVSLGAFIQSSTAEMTARATTDVPIDWQVELMPGALDEFVLGEMRGAAPITRTAVAGYASSEEFEASGGGTVQVTGPGKVLGIESNYIADFPGNIRLLLGKPEGVLIAQQTAASLHVAPGDSVTIHRPGLPDIRVTVDGVVDLLNADSMFQAVGAPPGSQPQAPPDNVLILPLEQWHAQFDPQAEVRPDSVRLQIHARLDRTNLVRDPQAAFVAVAGQGRNFEARVAGSALLANNLAAILDTTRQDAFYARVLFLFLGAPGAAVAVLLTTAVAQSGAARRRKDQSLLRIRGAPVSFLLKMAAIEALTIGACGSAIGVVAGGAVSRFLLSAPLFSPDHMVWLVVASLIGILLSLMAVLAPAWLDARHLTIVSARSMSNRDGHSLWRRAYLDVVCLALAALIFLKTAAANYQIVLAPEGVAAVSIDYWAFLSPILFWLGMGLLGLRLAEMFLSRAPSMTSKLVQPVASQMTPLVAAALSRQPRRMAAGVALTALAMGFAASTAIFNATYQAQSLVDAELTNGSDITVTGSSAAPADQALARLAAVPGVITAVPMQHRFAYVGTDLQDLYGIDPTAIGRAATMSNAFFGNGDSAASLAALRATPDGVLVSDETVTDFQLEAGDTINLRLQSASDHQYHVVPFRFVGIVREFPTAPSDSFLVANADYVAKMTGNSAAEVVLMRVAGRLSDVRDQAARIAKDIPGLKVRDITEARRLIGSSLTAVNLGGLTRLELSYAVVLSACAAGLMLGLGVLERRKSFVIMVALGARPPHLLAFLRGEALVILVAGLLLGFIAGGTVAWMLVKLLNGVFDPPPDHLTIPWPYLGILVGSTIASVAVAVAVTARHLKVSPIQILRDTSA